MKKYFILYILLLFYLNIESTFAISIYDTESLGSEITLIGYNLDSLIDADSTLIDTTIYPSGMQLPTKYMDVLDYIPYSGIVINNNVSAFMNSVWYNCNGYFTFAEYKACERFLYYKSALYYLDEKSKLFNSIKNVDKVFGWKIDSEFVTPSVINPSKLNTFFGTFREYLEALANNEQVSLYDSLYKNLITKRPNGFYLTAGINFDLNSFDYSNNIIEDYSEYLQYYPNYWEYFGIELVSVGFFIDVDNLYLIDMKNSIPVYYLYEEKKEEQVLEEEEESTIKINSENKNVIYNSVREYNDYVPVPFKVETINNYFCFTNDNYNVRDFLTIISLIFIFISVVSLCIIHTIRQRNDPLRKWLK